MNMLDATNHPKPMIYIIAKCQIYFIIPAFCTNFYTVDGRDLNQLAAA